MINWENIYYSLIKNRNTDIGEKHHVIPIHDNGKNSEVVILSRKNHILAHYIRWRWKKQKGDKVAYLMMSGQLVNPMHNIELRQYVMDKIQEYSSNPENKKKKSKEISERWNDNEGRQKIIEGRRLWIEKDNNKKYLAERLNTPEAREKSKKSLMNYYANMPKEHIEKIREARCKKIQIIESKKILNSVKEAAEYFKVSTRTIWLWAKAKNKIQYFK